MLKSLFIQNVKGVTTQLELQKFTAITGPNFSGKTACADALRLALIGYVPALGKTNQATYQLASGDPMVVEAIHENGTRWKREWTLKKGSVKRNDCDSGTWPSELLDIGVWLAANQKERIRMIAGASGASEELAASVEADYGETGIDTIEKLEARITELAEESKALKQQIKTFEGSMQGTTQIDSDEAVVTVDPEVLTKAQTRLGEAKLALIEANRREKELQWLDQEADEAAEALTNLPAGELADAKAELAELLKREQELAGSAGARKVEIGKLEESCNALEKKLAGLRDKRRTLAGDLSEQAISLKRLELEQVVEVSDEIFQAKVLELGEAKSKIAVLESTISANRNAMINAQSKIDTIAALQCCPTCANSEPGWKYNAGKAFVDEFKAAEALLKSANKDLETAKAVANGLESEVSELREERSAYAFKVKLDAAALVVDEMTTMQDELDNLYAKLGEQVQLREQNDDAGRLYQVAENIKATEARIKALENKDALEAKVAKRPSANDLHSVVNAVESAMTEIEQAEVQVAEAVNQTRLAAAQAERQRLVAESRARYDALVEQLEEATTKTKGMSDLLRAQNDALWGKINAAFEHFSEVAPEVKLAVRDGEIGAWTNGAFIPYDALSGSEQLMAGAAVQIGLSWKAPIKIVLLDELSRMTNETKKEFANALSVLIAHGIIDQVIVIDWDKGFWRDIGGVKVVDLME